MNDGDPFTFEFFNREYCIGVYFKGGDLKVDVHRKESTSDSSSTSSRESSGISSSRQATKSDSRNTVNDHDPEIGMDDIGKYVAYLRAVVRS